MAYFPSFPSIKTYDSERHSEQGCLELKHRNYWFAEILTNCTSPPWLLSYFFLNTNKSEHDGNILSSDHGNACLRRRCVNGCSEAKINTNIFSSLKSIFFCTRHDRSSKLSGVLLSATNGFGNSTPTNHPRKWLAQDELADILFFQWNWHFSPLPRLYYSTIIHNNEPHRENKFRINICQSQPNGEWRFFSLSFFRQASIKKIVFILLVASIAFLAKDTYTFFVWLDASFVASEMSMQEHESVIYFHPMNLVSVDLIKPYLWPCAQQIGYV